jgi:hypothetical protein
MVLILSLCPFFPVKAQDASESSKNKKLQNFFYIEIFGNAGIFSVNCEPRVVGNFFIRVGLGLNEANNPDSTNTFPLIVPDVLLIPNYLFPLSDDLIMECGIGAVALFNSHHNKDWLFWNKGYNSSFCVTGRLGIRYAHHNGSVLGIAFTPFIDTKPWAIFNFFGIIAGFTF